MHAIVITVIAAGQRERETKDEEAGGVEQHNGLSVPVIKRSFLFVYPPLSYLVIQWNFWIKEIL